MIRKNTIRHVGVIRHNHTIIEKEIRYRRRVPAPPMVVNFVTQKYRTVHRPALVDSTPVDLSAPQACCACAVPRPPADRSGHRPTSDLTHAGGGTTAAS